MLVVEAEAEVGLHEGEERLGQQCLGVERTQQRHIAVEQRVCAAYIGIARRQKQLERYGRYDCFEARFLVAALGEGQGVYFAAGESHVYLELLHECAAEGLALPVVEVAPEYAFKYAAEVVSHFVGLHAEYQHQYGELLGRVVQIARFLQFVEQPFNEVILLVAYHQLYHAVERLERLHNLRELLLERAAVFRGERVEEARAFEKEQHHFAHIADKTAVKVAVGGKAGIDKPL